MTPAELGLPRRFTEFRANQYENALAVATNDKRFTLMSSPTGSGKSLIYLAIAQLLDARTLILTGTKGLQQQLTADFASIGLKDIRGQNNYPCIALAPGGALLDYGRAGAGCDEGPCHIGLQCSLKPSRDGSSWDDGCTYYDAVARCADARLVITNYSYWLTAGRFADPDALGVFDLLILDEAHSAPDHLAEFCAVALDATEVHALLKRDLPPLNEGVEVWVQWARDALADAKQLFMEARQALISAGGDKKANTRRMKRLQDLTHRLRDLAGAHEWRRGEPAAPDVAIPGMQTDWIAEKTDDGALFSPVWAHAYAEEYLFRGIPKVVLTSATLQRAVARYLGIDDAVMDYSEFASAFDPRRRPLIYIPTTTVDRNMTEGQVRIWVNRIDGIIDGRLDRKGIIHTRSYDRALLIMQRSRHRNILISHDRRSTKDAIERFKRASAPHVLVSPSVEEGYDFPGDQARYQILAKVPFVDSRSLILQARQKSDKTYLNYLTALSIIQQVGRGMRAADDHCECVSPETLILTSDLRWVAAGSLRPGSRLLAVEENAPPGVGKHRCWRWSTVEKHKILPKSPRVRVWAEGVNVVCTPNHPWLVYGRGAHQARMLVWRRTDELTRDDHLIRALPLWDENRSWESGWAAGFTDGEGCLILRRGTRNPNATGLIISQNNGITADFAEELLGELEFDFHRLTKTMRGRMTKDAAKFLIKGGYPEILRYLGSIRPVRLLDKFMSSTRNEKFQRIGLHKIIQVQHLSPGPICSMQTSTATYLAEGLVAHNSMIIDDHWSWSRAAMLKQGLFPRWFKAAWRDEAQIPRAPKW